MVGVPAEGVRMCSVWSCGGWGSEWRTPGWTTPTTGWEPSSSSPTWITWITSCSDFSRLARGSPDSSVSSSKSLSIPLVSSRERKSKHAVYDRLLQLSGFLQYLALWHVNQRWQKSQSAQRLPSIYAAISLVQSLCNVLVSSYVNTADNSPEYFSRFTQHKKFSKYLQCFLLLYWVYFLQETSVIYIQHHPLNHVTDCTSVSCKINTDFTLCSS